MTAPPGGARLRARGVEKSFGPIPVLTGLDLDVPPGMTVGLLGPSGCGKSTLLRVLAGFEDVDAGTITVDDAPVVGPSPQRGMVAQTGGLLPWLTVRANLAFGPREARRSDRDIATEVAGLLERTGLSEFANALPRELSGGMRQRAAIAQVLANRPPVLLLDEPFAALDAQTRLRMHEWLRDVLASAPTTTVLVTHDVDEVLLLADRVLLLSDRPARVRDQVEIDLGSERGRDTVSDPRFVALKSELLHRVLAEPSSVDPASALGAASSLDAR